MKRIIDSYSSLPETPLSFEVAITEEDKNHPDRQNFIGLLVKEEEAVFFKKLAVDYSKEIGPLGVICP